MHSLTADPEPGDRQLLFVNVCLYMCLYGPLAEQSKHPIFLLHLADSGDVFTSVRSYVKRFLFLGYFSACACCVRALHYIQCAIHIPLELWDQKGQDKGQGLD